MVDLANVVWDDFITTGIPSSGKKKPVKSKIREWGTYIESLTMAASYGNTVWFATKALLTADLAHAAGVPAIVYADTTAANNGVYIKAGASGAGSWGQIITYLPGYQFVTATDAGAGTANAIVATSSPRVAYTDGVQLIRLNIFETNTSGTVTVAFDGGAALAVKTASNNNPAVGGLAAGMTILGVVDQSASVFRMLSDQASAAIQTAAEAAQAAAEAAQAAAEAIVGFDGTAGSISVSPAIFSGSNIQDALDGAETAVETNTTDIAALDGRLDLIESRFVIVYPTGDTTDRLAAIESAYSTALAAKKDMLLVAGDYYLSDTWELSDVNNVKAPSIIGYGEVRLRATGTQQYIVKMEPNIALTTKPFTFRQVFGTRENPIMLIGRTTSFTGTITNGSATITGIADVAGTGLAIGDRVRDWTDSVAFKFDITGTNDGAGTITLSSGLTGTRTVTLYGGMTENGILIHNVAHGKIYVHVRDVWGSAIRTECAVLCEIMPHVSTNAWGVTMDATTGLFLDRNASLSGTTACKILNPIIEGVSGFGLRFEYCIGTEVDVGTSEVNGGGILISAGSENNLIRGIFMEGNGASGDLSCLGKYNTLEHCRGADGAWALAGNNNKLADCFVGALAVSGSRNIINNTRWRTSFSNSGANTRIYNSATEGGTYTSDQ